MRVLVMTVLMAAAGVGATAWGEAVRVTHRAFQAVDEDGGNTFSGPSVVSLEGILLNNPEDWLDPTANYNTANMGGQWEIFIQGETDPNGFPDEAGTACWMGQNYGSLGWINPAMSYSDDAWLAELYRLNRDPNTQWVFRAGDRVRVTGQHLHYNGKRNINERHNNDPSTDFRIDLIKPAVGLPPAIEITLADLLDENNVALFDPNRLSGGEFYQSRRIRVENVYITNPQDWGPGNDVSIADGLGRSLRVRLGQGRGFERFACPEDWIDVIGILNQNGLRDGYYLMALNYDGSGRVLGEASHLRGNLPGDINGDYRVDLYDFVELAEHWLVERVGFVEPSMVE